MLVLLYLALYLHSVKGFSEFEYILETDTPKNWTRSVQSCADIQLDIAVDPDGVQSGRNTSLNVNIPIGTKAWMGHYLTYTEFYWYRGCYSSAAGMETVLDMGEETRLSICVVMCGNHTKIGLQLTNCICMSEENTYSPVNASMCDEPCLGYQNEMCGGKNAMSVYEIVAQNTTSVSNLFVDSECVTLEIQEYGDESLVPWWIVRPCMQPLAYVCQFHNESGTPYYVLETTNPTNWYGAQDACKLQGGSLAQIDKTLVPLIPKEPIGTPRWIGMLRIATWKEAEYYNADEEVLISCGALENVFRYNESKLEWSPTSCRTVLDFVCQNDTSIESTTVPEKEETTTVKVTTVKVNDTSTNFSEGTTTKNGMATGVSGLTQSTGVTTHRPLKSGSESRKNEDIYIGVGIVAAIFVVTVITVLVICFRRMGYLGVSGKRNSYDIMSLKEASDYNSTEQIKSKDVHSDGHA